VGETGIIAVETFLDISKHQIDLQKLRDEIQIHIKKLPLLNFVVLVGEFIIEESGKTILRTKARTIENPFCKKEIPHSILEATIKFEPPEKRLGSLLED